MKFLAVLLSVCILFLLTAGMIKPVEQPPGKHKCCDKTADMHAFVMKKMQEQHQKNCGKQACLMLFSCTLCGFIIVEPLRFLAHFTTYTEKPISLYSIGELSAYHTSDWKPPKAC
jgi:hypothetical protein